MEDNVDRSRTSLLVFLIDNFGKFIKHAQELLSVIVFLLAFFVFFAAVNILLVLVQIFIEIVYFSISFM